MTPRITRLTPHAKRPQFFPRSIATLLAAIIMLLLAQPVHAHVEGGAATGFATGFHHPWSGWDHILAMVAVGLWGAQLGKPAVWILPVTFPMVMAFGGFMGLVKIPLPGVEFGIAASAILLGLMVLLAAKPPLFIAAILVGVFGLFHGHAHGTELPAGHSALLYSIGFVIATGTLHALGIAIGLIHHFKPGKLALRAAGAGIAVAGVIFLIHAFQGEPEEPETQPATTAGAVTLLAGAHPNF